MPGKIALAALALSLTMAACTGNDPNEVRKQTANAAANVKKGSEVAAQDLKEGAKDLAEDSKAAAQGVREGLNREPDSKTEQSRQKNKRSAEGD